MKKNGHSKAKGANGSVQELSQKQIRELVDRQAKSMLGISADEVYRQLDQGKLRGTLAEAHFSLMRHLLEPK